VTSSPSSNNSAPEPVNGLATVGRGKQPPWAVVLLCHGSQRGTTPQECSCAWQAGQAGNRDGSNRDGNENVNETPGWCRNCPSTPQGLQDAAGRLERELGPESARVVLSCLEFIQPHPDQAVRSLVEQGFRQVVLMPYLLGHGKHATLELDEVLAELKAQSPQAQLYMSQGLGADGRLADLVVERIQDLNHPVPPAGRPATQKDRPAGVLLVKAGTKTQYDDCQWMKDLGQMVENRLGSGYAVDVAQSHYGDPTMDAAAASLVETRQVGSITCVPYLFFPGLILQRNVLGGLARLEERYPEIPMAATPPLGVDDRLVSVAADRIREVWQSQVTPTQ
jgi:sirohydrochlorin ferrochelatase